jgi:transcriptional regulator with XRE-family HTH domain
VERKLHPSSTFKKSVFMKNFKMSLKQLRKKYFPKQMALAESCGCSTAHISWLENGKRLPSLEMVLKISDALEKANATPKEISELTSNACTLITTQRLAGLKTFQNN